MNLLKLFIPLVYSYCLAQSTWLSLPSELIISVGSLPMYRILMILKFVDIDVRSSDKLVVHRR